IAEVRARLAKQPIDIIRSSVKDNPRIARLQAKLDEAKFRRIDLARQFKPANRQMRDVDEQIAALQQQLAGEPQTLTVRTHEPNTARPPIEARLVQLEAEREGQIAAHNAAVAEFSAKKRAVDELGPWEVQQTRLVNERDAAQSAYN